MIDVKALRVLPISSTHANAVVRALHYSGKVVPNSQLHLGVFHEGKCGGVMSFGPPIMAENTKNLVKGTQPREFLELNRLAFAEWLPKNSESRCLAYALRWVGNNYPFIKWVVSYADATQCGDGTIYRATGFVLTDIRANDALRVNPETGAVVHRITAVHNCEQYDYVTWDKLQGFQLRYVYFVHKHERANLTVPELPYSAIAEAGAGMYKGKPR